ncbi:MAG: SEC-C metal-binding domain-containing protein [Bradymonadaceae bacterium]
MDDSGPSQAELAAAQLAAMGVDRRQSEKAVDQGVKRAESGGRRFRKQQPVEVEDEPGRNDPCKCGSGRKYKKCCLREQKRNR